MIKVVLVGCGYWGKNWYNTLKNMEGVDVVCVIDPNPSIKVKTQAANLESFESLNLRYDKAVIASQAEYHNLYVNYFKNRIGAKNVLVEKPCGKISEDRSQYYDCFPGFIFLSSAIHKKIKHLLHSGSIGEVLYANFSRASMGPRIRTDVSIVEDYMIHDLYIFADLFQINQDKLKVSSVISNNLSGKILPDTAHVKLEHTDKEIIFSFFSSWIYPKKERSMIIVGSTGSIIWEGEKLYISRSHYKSIDGRDKRGNEGWDLLEYETEDITPQEKRSNIELQFVDFVDEVSRKDCLQKVDNLIRKILS